MINTKETAALAKLSFTEEKLASFEKDMGATVRFAEKISGAPLSEAQKRDSLTNILREDRAQSSDKTEGLLGCAPESSIDEGCFTVPRVVE